MCWHLKPRDIRKILKFAGSGGAGQSKAFDWSLNDKIAKAMTWRRYYHGRLFIQVNASPNSTRATSTGAEISR